MVEYIEIFKKNLDFIDGNNPKGMENTFFYKLENFELFDTTEYEKFIIGFLELILEHSKNNIFDKDLLANIIHMEYGILRTYILEQNDIEFLHKGIKYSFDDFSNILDVSELSFVDYGLFSFSYMLQQYCTRNVTNLNNIEQYILNKNLLV
jgi:hypothetical protein